MDKPQKDKAEQMVRNGKTIAHIARELGLDWGEVSAYVSSVCAFSWLGAKVGITNRLGKLKSEDDQDARQKLTVEIAERVNYIYYEGRRLSRELEHARKTCGD